MAPTLVVLAAGMGSRYGGLKQVEPVGPQGETLMDYSIYDALRAGFDKLVFVIRRDIERPFREIIGRQFESRLAVDYVFQELAQIPPDFRVPAERKKPWGTGHAVLTAASAVHEPFAVINADDFYGAHSFRQLADFLQPANPEYAMVGFVLRNTLSEFGSVARGVCRLTSDGYLQGIVELTRIQKDGSAASYIDSRGQVQQFTGDEIVSLNMWGFQPSIFGSLEQHFRTFLRQNAEKSDSEFYIPSVINSLVSSGEIRLKVLPTTDSWFGITYREDRPRVVEGIRRLIASGEYPEKLWAQRTTRAV